MHGKINQIKCNKIFRYYAKKRLITQVFFTTLRKRLLNLPFSNKKKLA